MAWLHVAYSCFLTALFIHAVSSQAPLQSCQNLPATILESTVQCQVSQVFSQFNNHVVSITVTKCSDPVILDVTIAPPPDANDQQLLLSERFSQHRVAVVLGDPMFHVALVLERNESHLFFQIVGGEEIIPEVTFYLNASDCMCASLNDLATRAVHSVVEPECRTNEACNGIRCELNLGFSLVYYVEVIVIPCVNALEVVIENGDLQQLHATNFTNETGTQSFTIDGFPLTARAFIEVFPYSMVVQASLSIPFIGEEEIIPRHRIILDRTRCNIPFIPTPPTTVATTSPTPPANPSGTCLAFFNIVASNQNEPFVCMLMQSCDKGVSCRLDIPGRQSYTINITLEEDREVRLVVTDQDRTVIDDVKNNDAIVDLPKTDKDTSLVFTQSISSNSLSVKLDLIRGDDLPQNLISQTVVPFPTPSPSPVKSSQTRVIAISVAVPLVILLLLAIVVVIGIWGCVLYVRHRKQTRPFEFKPMSYNDLQVGELEPYLTGAQPVSASTGGEKQGNGANGVSPADHEEEKKDLAAQA